MKENSININDIDSFISNLLDSEKDSSELLLNKFEEYKPSEVNYEKRQGIYAIFLKEEYKDFSKLNFSGSESIKKVKKELEKRKIKFDETNKTLAKNLIYIGKTHNNNSFYGRVTGERGHMQGGVSNLTGKIFCYLTGIPRGNYGSNEYYKKQVNDTDKYEFASKKDDYTYKDLIKDWLKKYTEFKFYTLHDYDNEENNFKNPDIVISLIEEVLIEVYKPALNKDSIKFKKK